MKVDWADASTAAKSARVQNSFRGRIGLKVDHSQDVDCEEALPNESIERALLIGCRIGKDLPRSGANTPTGLPTVSSYL